MKQAQRAAEATAEMQLLQVVSRLQGHTQQGQSEWDSQGLLRMTCSVGTSQHRLDKQS